MTVDRIDCEPWQEPISLLAAGGLPAEEEGRVRQHLAACSACAARHAELVSVCASLSRGRPPAADHAAALVAHWNEEAARPQRRGAMRRTSPLAFWMGGAAAALLIAVVWLGSRPGAATPAPRPTPVAIDGPKSDAERTPLARQVPPATTQGPAAPTGSRPTWRDFALALAKSDEAFEALLQRDGESVVLVSHHPQSLWKEFSQ